MYKLVLAVASIIAIAVLVVMNVTNGHRVNVETVLERKFPVRKSMQIV